MKQLRKPLKATTAFVFKSAKKNNHLFNTSDPTDQTTVTIYTTATSGVMKK